MNEELKVARSEATEWKWQAERERDLHREAEAEVARLRALLRRIADEALKETE